ncbi:MAG TPA: FAD-dependent oxidoreductase [Herpetosiphonaceae bacterium]
MDIAVVGAGVIGMTTGLRLRKDGHEVCVVANTFSPHTTSDIAAAFWLPFHVNSGRVAVWGFATYNIFCQLAEIPESGVSMTYAHVQFEESVPDPDWCVYVRGFRRAASFELYPGYVDGYVFEAPVIEMPVYMRYLRRDFESQGGIILQRHVHSLSWEELQTPVIVNCSGLGAATLADDVQVFPIRGQIVRVERGNIPPRVFLAEGQHHGITYIVPRSTDCILGGTAEDHNWSLDVEPSTSQSIITRCSKIEAQVGSTHILESLVGLRPGRHTVRLDAERLENGVLIVHNYGHGGAGVTLSWGCAEEVARLVANDDRIKEMQPVITPFPNAVTQDVAA